MALDGHLTGPESRRDPLLGQLIANCRVLARIGQGGMGAVYLAQHTVLGRHAAIKVLLPEISNNRELVGRFLNEARATAQLRHRGFVEIFDSGALPDGSAYLAMEYLRGANLADAIEWRTALTVNETLTVLREVAASVSYAHRHGIVHRDLKPDNIYLAVGNDDASERERVILKVLDFGIAKLTSAGDGRGLSGPSRTRTGSILGTPLYMSPEQCRGAGYVDHRADIYSLGCVAYHALTGRPPFALEGFGEIIAAHLNSAPAPVRALEPSVSEPVEAFVMALLAKEPDARPQTMDAVTTALTRLREAEGSGGDGDLLALVPPAALKGPLPSLSTTTPIGAATQPVPTAWPAVGPLPNPAAKSGETRLLPTSMRVSAPASTSTLTGTAAEVRHQRAGERRGGRAVAVTIGVLSGVGLTVALLLTFGGGNRHTQPRQAEDPARTSFSKLSADETPAPPAAGAPRGMPGAAAADERRPPRDPSSAGTTRASDTSLAGRTVTVHVASAPSGASVIDTKSGRLAGQTPFDTTVARAQGQLGLVLRKHGYRPKKITIDLGGNTEISVTLEKHPAGSSAPDESDEDRRKL